MLTMRIISQRYKSHDVETINEKTGIGRDTDKDGGIEHKKCPQQDKDRMPTYQALGCTYWKAASPFPCLQDKYLCCAKRTLPTGKMPGSLPYKPTLIEKHPNSWF